MSVNRTIFGLRSKQHGLIYEGSHDRIKSTVETAIQEKIDLTGIDLTGMDLRNINLDGIHLANADFSNSDLSGANISEAKLESCDFSGATLFDTCFCYSEITSCLFKDSRFGLTDFSQAFLSHSVFSGFSALSVSFRNAELRMGNIFCHEGDKIPLGMAPLHLQGLNFPVTFFGEKILIGNDLFEIDAASLDAIRDIMLQMPLKTSTKN